MEAKGFKVHLVKEPRYVSSRHRLRSAWKSIEGEHMKIDNFRPEQWVSVQSAASLAGVHREWMRRLAKAGRVPAFEIDGQWFILRKAAETYVRGKPGRPRKQESR